MDIAKGVDLDALRDAIKAVVGVVEYTSARMGVEWTRRSTRHVSLCLYHDERTPSLTVEDASPERAYCHGCGTHADIIKIARDHQGLGYREALHDLADFAGLDPGALDGYTPPPRPAPAKQPKKSPRADVEKKPKARKVKRLRTRRWKIRSADGTHVATHCREDWLLADDTTAKNSWWESPSGQPGLGGLKVADLPLYHAESIGGYPLGHTVYVTEGEKDCDALIEAGYCAVATVTGAGGCPSAASLEVLRGRDVVMWRDDDQPGLEHAVKVCRAIEVITKSVRVHCHPVAGVKGAGAADHPAILAEIERRRAADSEREGA